MIIGVPKEIYPEERRVALVPSVLPTLTKAGFEVQVQSGAGIDAGYPDSQYADKGAKIVADRAAVFAAADIVVQILCYGSNDVTGKQDVPLYRRDQILVGFLRPFGSADVVQEIAHAGVTAFSVELMPRTTRAQSMDALSSMGTVCGYKSVLMAANHHPRFFPMLTTAAGTITPARVFVIRDVKVTTVKLAAPDDKLIELLQFHSHPDRPSWIGTPYSTGLTHIALTVDDLDSVYRKLAGAGVTFFAPPQRSPDGIVKVTYCQGPEDLLLELVEVIKV